MLRYAGRRLLVVPLMLLAIAAVVFSMVHLVPGDPAEYMLRDVGSKQDVEALRHAMGLDAPLYIQYGRFVWRLAHGDLGRSLISGRRTAAEISSRLPYTIELAAASMLVACAVGMPAGILSAARPNSPIDHAGRVAALLGVSMPTFWLGLLLMLVFALRLGVLPAFGEGGPPWTLDGLRSLVLPAVMLGAPAAAIIARMCRSSLLEVLGSDYVRTARAKGLRGTRVVRRHGLKAAFLPVLTVMGVQAGSLLAGAIVTESVFAWPGLGRLTVDAILKRDLPVIQGSVLLFTLVFTTVNLVVDLSYGLLDPRIRYQ
jgi:peptide/nickel transport system permease protein